MGSLCLCFSFRNTTMTKVMTWPAIVWLVVMGSKRFASPIMGIICGGLNACCMPTRPLFLRTSGSSFFFFFRGGGRDIHYMNATITSGSSGVLKALLLERNGQLSCNPPKKKKKTTCKTADEMLARRVSLSSKTSSKQGSCSPAESRACSLSPNKESPILRSTQLAFYTLLRSCRDGNIACVHMWGIIYAMI